MSQDNAFINHKVALLPIQDKISFFTSLQNSIKVGVYRIRAQDRSALDKDRDLRRP
jgi:hypothetical protein